jgi:hypothetical protein
MATSASVRAVREVDGDRGRALAMMTTIRGRRYV